MKKPTVKFEDAFPDKNSNQYLLEMFAYINFRRTHPVETDPTVTDKDVIQYHHIIQKFWFKQKHLKIDNSSYNVIGLTVSEHIRMHCLLYKYYLSIGDSIMADSNERYLVLQARRYLKQGCFSADALTPDILDAIEKSTAEYRKKLKVKFKNGIAATYNISAEKLAQMHKNQGKSISGENNPMSGLKRIKLICPETKDTILLSVFPEQNDCIPEGYVKYSDYVFKTLQSTINAWKKYGRGKDAYEKAVIEIGKTEFSQTYSQFRSVIYRNFPQLVKVHSYVRRRKYDVKILKQIADDYNAGATKDELFEKYGRDMPVERLHVIMKRHGIFLIDRRKTKNSV